MERTANIDLAAWRADRAPRINRQLSQKAFAGILIGSACVSALFASWLPLQFSIVTVFLFAGPHNWFELRYFLMRLPVRFGKSRNFFLTAFAGIGFLTATYISLPVLYGFNLFPDDLWPTILASWNTLLLLVGAAVVSTATMIAKANAGPPGSYYWRKLPQNLTKGTATNGYINIEIVPEGSGIKLIVPTRPE